MERIRISGDRFIFAESRKPFTPWGVNYGNAGRLIEDFWQSDWETLAGDFREIKALGGNVVRVHLQLGRFMRSPKEPDPAALANLARLLSLAESTQLYLDITGLACYRPSDTPRWYDSLDEKARWDVQASFWSSVAQTCAGNASVFCYNLMNEPISPASQREKWYSGHLLGGYDFVQYISRDPGGRSRSEIAVEWIRRLSAAIREKDPVTPITVGLLPWVTGWQHLSGFVPRDMASHVDFISVHIYPKSKQPDEAARALHECKFGLPVLVEEIFPLECSVGEMEGFVRSSSEIAAGWIWHYDGITLTEYDALERVGKLTLPQAVWRDALKSFARLRPEVR